MKVQVWNIDIQLQEKLSSPACQIKYDESAVDILKYPSLHKLILVSQSYFPGTRLYSRNKENTVMKVM